MRRKVTIQDIANELGLSRNTVSKALNSSPGLAEETRERILQKAIEMGYKQFAAFSDEQTQRYMSMPVAPTDGPDEIALLTAIFIDHDHFASHALDILQNDLSRKGYVLNTHRVAKEDLAARRLPPTVKIQKVAAFICIEVFDHGYADMVCDLNVPTLFLDGPAKLDGYKLRSDQLYMNNYEDITRLVHDMVSQGVISIGFVGDWTHCQSFHQRYIAFRMAMVHEGIPVDERHCIGENEEERILPALSSLDTLPQFFVCANDFVAFDTQRALKGLGLSVPEDVLLSGFDDSSASRNWIPSMTTVNIQAESIAHSAMQLLMTRLRDPSQAYRELYTGTDLIYRDSTRRG